MGRKVVIQMRVEAKPKGCDEWLCKRVLSVNESRGMKCIKVKHGNAIPERENVGETCLIEGETILVTEFKTS